MDSAFVIHLFVFSVIQNKQTSGKIFVFLGGILAPPPLVTVVLLCTGGPKVLSPLPETSNKSHFQQRNATDFVLNDVKEDFVFPPTGKWH